MLTRTFFATILALVMSGCEYPKTVYYCDSEVRYILTEQKTGFQLELSIGHRMCERKIGSVPIMVLHQAVSSQEEAREIIDEYRQKFAEKLKEMKVAEKPTESP